MPSSGRRVAYVRGMDGSPAVRLGEGTATALSPDKRWALVYRGEPAPSLVLLPTGAGEEKVLPRGPIAEYDAARSPFAAAFFPDGKRLIFRGMEDGKPRHLFLQDVEGGRPEALRGRSPFHASRLAGREVDCGSKGHRR